MMDLIVFSVGNNRYSLNIENIQRIIQAEALTAIPNASKFIDGMMNYEGRVIKVLNFRKLIGLPAYDKELVELFTRLKIDHQDWMNKLEYSIENGSVFTKSVNPYKCELGIWLNNFNSYDDEVSKILKSLITNQRYLYTFSSDLLELCKSDKQNAVELMKKDLHDVYNRMINDLDSFIDNLETVANSLQKLLIYEYNNLRFAIKVDSIEDIVQIDENKIMESDNSINELELYGISDINGVLVNIIKSITIQSKEGNYGNQL
jgi:chemotaxis signal transduction protein